MVAMEMTRMKELREFSARKTKNGGWVLVDHVGERHVPGGEYAFSSSTDFIAQLPSMMEAPTQSELYDAFRDAVKEEIVRVMMTESHHVPEHDWCPKMAAIMSAAEQFYDFMKTSKFDGD
jgi:hypothetical protein